MSHRVGSVVAQIPGFAVGPGSGVPPTSPGVWERTFSPPAHPNGTKYLILHFTGASLGAGDRVEVVRGPDPDPFHARDVFTAANGPSFWSRPVTGNSVIVRFVDGGDGTGQAAITEYGRGEGIRNGGDTTGGGNANGDMFMLDPSWDDPTFFNVGGVCPSGSSPSWENTASLPAGVMRETARKVGMMLHSEGDHLSTCTATLIAPDLILTAGHCLAPEDVDSASFTFDFETDASGSRPAGYSPRFYRLTRFVRGGFARAPADLRPGRDYAIAEIATHPAGLGIAPAAMRTTPPVTDEEVFIVHHPRGTAKKISRRPADPMARVLAVFTNEVGKVVRHNCDIDNGSSGSSLFDAAGRIIAVNNWAPGACNGLSLSIIEVQDDLLTEPPPVTDIDVMVVFDRSGSMSLPSHTAGMTKIEHARRAAALFVDLIRKDRTHRVGLVTFSTAATSPPAFVGLQPATDANETTLIGPPPTHNAGLVGGIVPGGLTTIGGGLQLARTHLPAPGAAVNTPAILLLTDGLQNTPPMVADVEASLGGTHLSVLGFGTEASLDGGLLTRLARDHGGLYARAEDGLALRKFFVLAFGNIFESGISMDPLYELPAGATEAKPIELKICGESRLTVVLGWEQPVSQLLLSLVTPGGTVLTAATAGLVASSGDTWAYLRLPLPFAGERDGAWEIRVSRLEGGGELAPPLTAERFFVASVIHGGPYMRPLSPRRRYYTGDVVNPLVQLRHPSGAHVDATMMLEVDVPADGTGNILAASGLRESRELDGDVLDARSSALTALEDERGGPVVGRITHTFELFDDAEHDDGAMEPDGIFGNPLRDLARTEGSYTFRAVAEFGDGCTATRETFWSAQVDVGIDPRTTTVTTTVVGTQPDGRQRVQVTVTPRDRFGNHVGPGRVDGFEITAPTGGELSGALTDLGDGSYVQEVLWDPTSSIPPGLIITQPERPPVIVLPALPPARKTPGRWLLWLLLLLLLLLLIIVLWLLVS